MVRTGLGIGSWGADYTFGRQPLSYKWFKNGVLVSTSSSYWTQAWTHFDLKVKVTDANGQLAIDDAIVEAGRQEF